MDLDLHIQIHLGPELPQFLLLQPHHEQFQILIEGSCSKCVDIELIECSCRECVYLIVLSMSWHV